MFHAMHTSVKNSSIKILFFILFFCGTLLSSPEDIALLNREEIDTLIAHEKLSTKEVFDAIYHTNYWNNSESVSGGGSTLATTTTLRKLLPIFLRVYKVNTLIDAPCGDLNWMQQVNLENINYIGVDIVEALIAKNKEMYGDVKHAFLCLDITTDVLPQGEMILCRDCFQHLSYEKIFQALRLFKKSGAVYLLTTTYLTTKKNHDIHIGDTCLYNLELPPFNFPKPIRFIEEITDKKYRMSGKARKGLGLWKLDSIFLEERE